MTYNAANYLIDQYTIETHTEVVGFGSQNNNPARGFSTTNNNVNAIFAPVNTHSYNDSIFFDEGDYEIYLQYLWRHINIGSGIVAYYGGNSSSPRLYIGKDTDTNHTSSGTPVADGTFTQIGSNLYHSQTAPSTLVLKIELGMKFRVEGNPIVPKFTTYDWSGYHAYSAGVQYNIQVKKYELNSLS